MEVSHAISQLRSIVFMAKDSHLESVEWLTPEIEHAEEHLECAVNFLDKIPSEWKSSALAAVPAPAPLLARGQPLLDTHSGPHIAAVPAPALDPAVKESLTVQLVCSICGGPAEFRERENCYRHKGKPWGTLGAAQSFCDKYGYPIEVVAAVPAPAPVDEPVKRTQLDILLDRKCHLENGFGYGAYQDGLTRQKLEEVGAKIAQLTSAPVDEAKS